MQGIIPYDMSVGGNAVFVSGRNGSVGMIKKFDFDGNLLWTESDPFNDHIPDGIAASADDDVYFIYSYTDYYECKGTLGKLNSNGDPTYLASIYNCPASRLVLTENDMLFFSTVEWGGYGGEVLCYNTEGVWLRIYDPNAYASYEHSCFDESRNSLYFNYVKGSGLDDMCIYIGEGSSVSSKNLHYAENVCAFAADQDNVFFCGYSYGQMYIDYGHLPNSGFFIAKCTDVFSLLSDEFDYVGLNREIACGESTMIGHASINPYLDQNPEDAFSEYSWNWNDPNLPDHYNANVSPFETTDYTLSISTGNCSLDQHVEVTVNKETHFRYTVEDMTLSLEMIDGCGDFTWDFGDGNTNSINTSPTYTYSTEGAFSVCLQCADNPAVCATCTVLQFPGNYSDSTNSPLHVNYIDYDEIIKVYPNPVAGGELRISFGHEMKGYVQILLKNKLGQTVFSRFCQVKPEASIELPSLGAGLYILNILGEDFMVSRKIIMAGSVIGDR